MAMGGCMMAMLEDIEAGQVDTMKAEKDNTSQEYALLKKASESMEVMSTEQKAELCRFFRVNRCWKEAQSRITFAYTPSKEGQELRLVMIAILKAMGFEFKVGRSPPGHLERELQAWVEACT